MPCFVLRANVSLPRPLVKIRKCIAKAITGVLYIPIRETRVKYQKGLGLDFKAIQLDLSVCETDRKMGRP